MSDPIPPVLREALEALGFGVYADHYPSPPLRADRARAMAAALRWAQDVVREDYPADPSDDSTAWALTYMSRAIAALEQEARDGHAMTPIPGPTVNEIERCYSIGVPEREWVERVREWLGVPADHRTGGHAMKAQVGDWARCYRDGCLTIGVVLYTRTTISGGVEYLTDCGVMTEDSVLEVRSHPEGGAGPLPAYPEGGRMSNPIPAALREAQGSMNWGLCPQCGETYERLACGPSHATRRAVVVEQYGRRCMAAALRWALGPGYEDEAGPSFREVIAALEQESEATP